MKTGPANNSSAFHSGDTRNALNRSRNRSAISRALGVACLLAVSAFAAEPIVIEQTRPDGLTELRVVADGRTNATYRVDLKTHHEPATGDTGLIRQWESYRYGGFFCFNDNQYDGNELSRNTDAKLYNPTNLDVPGWAGAMKKAGDEWKGAAAGTTIGSKRELTFAPVTAQVFRLNITEATDVPTLWEFQLFTNEDTP